MEILDDNLSNRTSNAEVSGGFLTLNCGEGDIVVRHGSSSIKGRYSDSYKDLNEEKTGLIVAALATKLGITLRFSIQKD